MPQREPHTKNNKQYEALKDKGMRLAILTNGTSAMLDALWGCLARGGTLVYATCSVFKAENEAQAAAFAGRHADALRETLSLAPETGAIGGQLLPSSPGAPHNQDGFFYARFRKG